VTGTDDINDGFQCEHAPDTEAEDDATYTWKGICQCNHTALAHLLKLQGFTAIDGSIRELQAWACYGEKGSGGLPPRNPVTCGCEKFIQRDAPLVGRA